jgi:hypothetical protein
MVGPASRQVGVFFVVSDGVCVFVGFFVQGFVICMVELLNYLYIVFLVYDHRGYRWLCGGCVDKGIIPPLTFFGQTHKSFPATPNNHTF